jgi:hypothetical protein
MATTVKHTGPAAPTEDLKQVNIEGEQWER